MSEVLLVPLLFVSSSFCSASAPSSALLFFLTVFTIGPFFLVMGDLAGDTDTELLFAPSVSDLLKGFTKVLLLREFWEGEGLSEVFMAPTAV